MRTNPDAPEEKDQLTALIRKAMKGNTEAFEQLIERFRVDILYSVSSQLDRPSQADAEDIAQEATWVLYRNIGKLKSPHAFYAYLRTVIARLVLRHNQKARRTRTEDIEEYGELSASPSEQPEAQVEQDDLAETVKRLLGKLPERQRETLYLYYYRDLSYKEIAERQQVSINTVGTNMNKAKTSLKKMLERQGNMPHKDVEKNELLGGVAIAPLLHEAFERSLAEQSVHESGERLLQYCHQLVADHPDAILATSAIGGGYLVKGIIAATATALASVATYAAVSQFSAPATSGDSHTALTRAAALAIYYEPEASISFVGASGAEHINPTSALVSVAEGTLGSWRITDATGALVREGTGEQASLEALSPGDYTLVFDLIDPSGVATATVSRAFTIA